MHRLTRKLSYSNVVSTLCLVLLLGGGTAYAASRLGKESVGAHQLKKGAVTPAKLSSASRRALTGPRGESRATGAAGAAGPQGTRGERGDRGERGEKGDPGEPGRAPTELWAVVSATPEAIRARNAVSVEGVGSGSVVITFAQDVSQCDYQATLANPANGEPPLGFIGASSRSGSADAVFVQTWDKDQVKAPEPFHLAVYC
jgi:hypothetical protein